MDPITGVIALGGLSLASLVGLQLRKNNTEGFDVVPNTKDGYVASVDESQSRYNMLTNMVNPLINGLIPVGSSDRDAQAVKSRVKLALGNTDVKYSNKSDGGYTLDLQATNNKYKPRSDGNNSIFAAINFCKSAGANTQPFSTYNSDGSLKTKGVTSADGNFVFDELCGVCLTGGVDEEGKPFKGKRGLIMDPNSREAAISEAKNKTLPYIRGAPSLATCEGAPDMPVFATNAVDMARFGKRLLCISERQIDPAHQCGICFENDTYSYVEPGAETMSIHLVLQGFGNARVLVKGQGVATLALNETSTQVVELLGGKESDAFGVSVTLPDGAGSKIPTLFGYLEATNPNGGKFQMPLNLLLVVDDITGSTPKKSGGFYTFSDVNIEVAKMRPSAGRNAMSLRGTIPFTFVSPDEFSAIDCPSAPYQTNPKSVSDFATDQPCFAKGAGPGKYNVECLRANILAVGCTNAGELYKDPSPLNNKNGVPQKLSDIYAALQDIADNDMIDKTKTKMCSGRDIDTPCDPFIAHPELKFGGSELGEQCVSYLYQNKGANEAGPVKRIGPTYTGIVTYSNNRKEQRNIYCLPEGTLNPDTNKDSLAVLISKADNGYNGKTSVDAVKAYLNDQLELAVDMTKNANTDPERKSAIARCFGRSLKSLPMAVRSSPTVVNIPCGVLGRYVRVLPTLSTDDNWLQISQLVVIDKTGNNVALKKPTTASASWDGNSGPGNVVDGVMAARNFPQIYHSARNLPTSAGNTNTSVFWMVDLGSMVDITKVIYYNRSDCCNARSRGMRVQILDENKNIVGEQSLPSYELKQELLFLNQGVDAATCKSTLNVPPPPSIPAGYKPGLYVRFYRTDSANPSTEVGGSGWGPRIGTANAYNSINFNDNNLPKPDQCFVVAKGFFISSGQETLQLATVSDDGIYVLFNNQVVISNWNIHGPQVNYSADINIPNAGVYPFELRFYEWGGGAQCWMGWMVNRDSSQWKTDLSSRFVFNAAAVQAEEARYQGELQAAAARAAAKPYSDEGCWNDTWNRALSGPPQQYGYTVESCAQYARSVGADTFALQHGGWCVVNRPGDNYQRYGRAGGDCPTLGGGWVNHVFKLNPGAGGSTKPYTDQGCWSDTWNRALSGAPQQYGYTVDSCYKYAKAVGANTFALQDNGWCVVNRPGDNYQRYGKAGGDCPPLGAGWKNHVYTVNN